MKTPLLSFVVPSVLISFIIMAASTATSVAALTLTSARTLGNATQVTVVFSEAVADPFGSANFAINNGITVTNVARSNTNTIDLMTTTFTIGNTYTLTVNGITNQSGSEILTNSQIQIDLSVEVPLDYGREVNGFQDDFSGTVRDINWESVGVGEDIYVQTNGVSKVFSLTGQGDPNHLLYVAPGYDNAAQEVLARIRVNAFNPGGVSRAGVTVGADPNQINPGAGINLLGIEDGGPVSGKQFVLLDDNRAFGPIVPNLIWQTNTWYWLRLRQTSSSSAGGPNISGKVWLADGTAPEPPAWQVTFSRNGRSGFAGIEGPSGSPLNANVLDYDVDYILIKAAGLPSTNVAPSAFSLVPPSTLNITQQPQDVTKPIQTTATFTVSASGTNLVYQWQKAAPATTNFVDIAGANDPSYTTPVLDLADSGSQYRCVVGARLTSPQTTREALLTVTTDVTKPTLVSAKTLGNPNQVTVVFSEPIQNPATTDFAINNGIVVNGVVQTAASNTIELATSSLAPGTYTLTVNGIKDLSGNQILTNSQISIDLFVEVPLDYGQTVNGFQDDFTGVERDTNWVSVGNGQDAYSQSNGVLKVSSNTGDPNHLLYLAPGYDNAAQEVLARIKVNVFSPGGASRAGIVVGSNPNDATHPGGGINLLAIEDGGPVSGKQFVLLDDNRAFGPIVPNLIWQTTTWYWLRLRQTSSSSTNGPNISGKVWLADGTVPEPPDWQVNWSRDGRTGFAGIEGPTGGETDYDVDYILIKAAGLPSIKVAPSAFALVAAPRLTMVRTGNNVVLTWTGGGALESADSPTGSWTTVAGAASPYTAAISGPAQFYRVRQ